MGPSVIRTEREKWQWVFERTRPSFLRRHVRYFIRDGGAAETRVKNDIANKTSLGSARSLP